MTNTSSHPYLAVLRECPEFRRLFLARVISLLGDWFSLIAVMALIRDVEGSDAKALSGFLILKLLPMFLAGPIAGVVADRFSRKTIMIVSDVSRGILALGMLLTPLSAEPLPWIYTIVTLQVVGSAFFEPARNAALPQIVPSRHLEAANALGALAWSLIFTVGAMLGGVVTALLGWRMALLVDAATYFVSTAILLKLVLPKRERRKSGSLDVWTLLGIRDFVAGCRYIFERPQLAVLLSIKAGWGFGGAITLLLTLYGERVYAAFGKPDLGIALLFTARAVGTGIGPLVSRRILVEETPQAIRRLIGGAFLWAIVWYAVFAWADHIVVALLAIMLAHCGGSILWVSSTVYLQRMTEDDFRGRVMSTDLGLTTFFISVTIGLYGVWAASPDADLDRLIMIMCVSLVLPTAFWLYGAKRWPIRLPKPG